MLTQNTKDTPSIIDEAANRGGRSRPGWSAGATSSWLWQSLALARQYPILSFICVGIIGVDQLVMALVSLKGNS